MTSSQQRAALQRQIWQIANDVRGAVDGWDFNLYVLGTLFYRFISENFATQPVCKVDRELLKSFEARSQRSTSPETRRKEGSGRLAQVHCQATSILASGT